MNAKKQAEDIVNFKDIEELEEKIPVFAAARLRENEVLPDQPYDEAVPGIYNRVVHNNVLMDALLFLEKRKNRPLLRHEAEKIKRLVDSCLSKPRPTP